MDPKFVVIRHFPALIHAELAKSALEAYEIDAAIAHPGASTQRLRAELGMTITLLVREEDVEAALEILGPPDERFSD